MDIQTQTLHGSNNFIHNSLKYSQDPSKPNGFYLRDSHYHIAGWICLDDWNFHKFCLDGHRGIGFSHFHKIIMTFPSIFFFCL